MSSAKFTKPVINMPSGKIQNQMISQDILKERNGFMLIYSPTCPPCINMASQFQKLAIKSNERIAIIAIDGQKYPEIYKKLPNVQGTPTMLFVNRNGEIGSEFNGQRTTEDMMKFICSNVSNNTSGFCLI